MSRRINVLNGQYLTATPVFDTYWRFAAERQALFMRRVRGEAPPWTTDPVLSAHRFTNAYRASDRVSQYLIRHVLYQGDQSTPEILFRCLLFKVFNRIDTWEFIVREVGWPEWRSFDAERYAAALDRRMRNGARVYSAAYIMPPPKLGSGRKHRRHLLLLSFMLQSGLARTVDRAQEMSDVYRALREFPSIGGFLAFQYAVDLNYSTVSDFCESGFVVAGPGAKRGIRKCFSDTGGLSDEQVIHAVTDMAEDEFDRLGVHFETLWGRRLHPIDCQNLFCEVDKYARVVHPEFNEMSGKLRIKQRFRPDDSALPQWYPPKWGLSVPAALSLPA